MIARRRSRPPCSAAFRPVWVLLALCLAFAGSSGRVAAQEAGATDASPAATPAPVEAGLSATGQRLVKFAGSGVPIERALDSISKQAGRTAVARGKAAGQQVSLIFKDETFDSAVQKIANSKPNFILNKPEDSPGTVEIWDTETYNVEVRPRMVRQKVFAPRNISAEDAAKAVQGILTPQVGSVAFDARGNKVFVTDLPYVLEIAQRLIDQIDVDYITRVFYITNADVASIAEKIGNLRSSAAPQVEVDERTHQIIVRDRLENIRKMELLIEALDKGPDIRVYDLNNIGPKGDDSKDLEDALNKIITKDAFYQINQLAGKLVLQDIPEIHEKVEKLLAALDQPAKQVLLQIEIIETNFSDSFQYGIDYTLSKDLFSAALDGLVTTPNSNSTAGNQPSPVAGVSKSQNGSIPYSTRSGAVYDKNTLGFTNFRSEFPITRVSGSGIDTRFLSKNAFITLQAAMKDSRTRVLQQPRVIALNQKPVLLNIGQEIPYFTAGNTVVNTNNNNGVQTNAPTQSRLNVGLNLDITPVIGNNGLVRLQISFSNDTPLFRTTTFNGQPFEGVGRNTQQIDTEMIVPTGETRVIGGLVSDSKGTDIGGVPGLVKIPVIGPALFGSYNRAPENNYRRNLLVFITPTIVEEKAPKEITRYRGRAYSGDLDAGLGDLLTTPSATMTDIGTAPPLLEIPPPSALNRMMEGPAPGDRPWTPSDAGGRKRRAPAMGITPIDRSASPMTRGLGTGPAAGFDELAPAMPESAAPDLSRLPAPEGAEAPASTAAGFAPLRRVKIDNPGTSGSLGYVSRIPAPSGGFNTGVGLAGGFNTTGPSGAPAGSPAGGAGGVTLNFQPGTQPAFSPGRAPVSSGSFAAPAANVPAAATPPPPPPPVAPSTETRY